MKKYLLVVLFTFVSSFAFSQDKLEIESNINKILLKARDYYNGFFGGAISLQIFDDDKYSTSITKVTMPNTTEDIFYRVYFWKDAKWSTKPEAVIEKGEKDAPEITRVNVKFKTFGDVFMERSSGLRTPYNQIILFCLNADAAELKKLVDDFVKKVNE